MQAGRKLSPIVQESYKAKKINILNRLDLSQSFVYVPFDAVTKYHLYLSNMDNMI
jgi:hypothetical protein